MKSENSSGVQGNIYRSKLQLPSNIENRILLVKDIFKELLIVI